MEYLAISCSFAAVNADLTVANWVLRVAGKADVCYR